MIVVRGSDDEPTVEQDLEARNRLKEQRLMRLQRMETPTMEEMNADWRSLKPCGEYFLMLPSEADGVITRGGDKCRLNRLTSGCDEHGIAIPLDAGDSPGDT